MFYSLFIEAMYWILKTYHWSELSQFFIDGKKLSYMQILLYYKTYKQISNFNEIICCPYWVNIYVAKWSYSVTEVTHLQGIRSLLITHSERPSNQIISNCK